MASIIIDNEAIRRAAARSTRDSARLEGRVVPPDYARPARLQHYLAERRRRA